MVNNLDIRRHMDLFDATLFKDRINIIGAGATGSWLALIFAKLGIDGSQIHVWDFDHVEEHNIPNQAYMLKNSPGLDTHSENWHEGHVGKSKVGCLRDIIDNATGANINPMHAKFINGRLNGYVFNMVDSMAGRKEIWEKTVKMKSAVKLLVEPRMGLDMGRIYNVDPMNMEHIRQYEDTFYSDEEAEVSACGTSQTVITTAMATASTCARQLINHVAGEELDNEILTDYKYNNLITTKW